MLNRRLCVHNTADSIWIWQMLLEEDSSGILNGHFENGLMFQCAIVCMAIVSAMD